jgi:hypothetical protein
MVLILEELALLASLTTLARGPGRGTKVLSGGVAGGRWRGEWSGAGAWLRKEKGSPWRAFFLSISLLSGYQVQL